LGAPVREPLRRRSGGGPAVGGDSLAVLWWCRIFVGHFYSIPEHRSCGDLVVTESVSAFSQRKEDNMIQSRHSSLRTWVGRNHVLLVLLLSLLHVWLAALHTRDSGKIGLASQFEKQWRKFANVNAIAQTSL
jgi:hypothetical protein